MRNIEFRGYSERDSEWRHGSYSTDGVIHEILTLIKAGTLYASQVPLESIGQYTGLKDANGVKIFEGDILRHPVQEPRKVIYPMNETTGFFGLESVKGWKNTLQDTAFYKVIGNIYENPEKLQAITGAE